MGSPAVGYGIITIAFLIIMSIRSSLYKDEIKKLKSQNEILQENYENDAFITDSWRNGYYQQRDENIKYRRRIRVIADWVEGLPDDIKEDMLNTIFPGSIHDRLLDIDE